MMPLSYKDEDFLLVTTVDAEKLKSLEITMRIWGRQSCLILCPSYSLWEKKRGKNEKNNWIEQFYNGRRDRKKEKVQSLTP